MSKYLLLLNGGDYEGYSEEEGMKIIAKYIAWTDKLKNDGSLVASEELKNGGRNLSVQNGQVVDGPFTETKEAVGGFYLITADSFDQAATIAKGCPHLEYNGTIELREIMQR